MKTLLRISLIVIFLASSNQVSAQEIDQKSSGKCSPNIGITSGDLNLNCSDTDNRIGITTTNLLYGFALRNSPANVGSWIGLKQEIGTNSIFQAEMSWNDFSGHYQLYWQDNLYLASRQTITLDGVTPMKWSFFARGSRAGYDEISISPTESLTDDLILQTIASFRESLKADGIELKPVGCIQFSALSKDYYYLANIPGRKSLYLIDHFSHSASSQEWSFSLSLFPPREGSLQLECDMFRLI